MEKRQRKLEVCFTPELYKFYHNKDSIVVIADILRATTAIVTAFENGVKELIPVASIEDAETLKSKGYLLAAERDGIVLDFADFGNSPFNFTGEQVSGKTIAYSTTNGTNAVQMARDCYMVAIGAFINLSSLAGWLVRENKDVVIFCAGWKGKFNLEDSVFAGALSERLLKSGYYSTECDSVNASLDLWEHAKSDLTNYIDKAAQRHRLKKLGLDDVIEYCHTIDASEKIPVLKNGVLVDLLAV
jgi:2-phosphosulfolactate phosphatase